MAPATEMQTTAVCMAGLNGAAGGHGPAANAAAEAAASPMLDMRFSESVSGALARLYKNPVSAIQEIVANAVAACKAARDMHGADSYIRIHVSGRNLSIEDRNSMGMSWPVFRDVYARAGSSLKLGPNGAATPGMFGCGSLSYVLVSDVMFLASHSRQSGERYEVMALDGRGFQTGLPEPDINWYGTRIRLTIREGVKMEDVFDRIAAISSACGVRIVVDLDGADRGCTTGLKWRELAGRMECADDADAGLDADAAMDDAAPPPGTGAHSDGGLSGRYVLEASTFDDEVGRIAAEQERLKAKGDTDLVCIRAESDDLDVAAINCCNTMGEYYRMTVNRTWLAGMPIAHTYDSHLVGSSLNHHVFSASNNWIVLIHAKNERVYTPTPDRERFPDEAYARIVKEAERLLIGRIKEIRPATLPEYLSDPSNRALEPCAAHRTEPQDNETRRSRGTINDPPFWGFEKAGIDARHLKIAQAAGPVSLASKDVGRSLWSVLYTGADSDERRGSGRIDEPLLIVSDRPNARLWKAVMDHAMAASGGRRRVVVFCPHRRNVLSADDYVELGCVDAAEYAKANGLLAKKAPKRERAGGKGAAGKGTARSGPRPVPTKREYVVHCGGLGSSGKRGTLVPVLKTKRLSARPNPDGWEPSMKVVRCDDSESFAAMQAALAVLECDDVGVTREQSDVPNVAEFADYARSGGEAMYETTMGRASGRDLAGCGRRAVLVVYNRPAWKAGDLAAMIADAAQDGDLADVVYVFGKTVQLVACAAHLHSAGARFGVWMLPYYDHLADDVLADKSYIAGVAERSRSPVKAAGAASWIDTAICGVPPGNMRAGCSSAMEILHAHLEGESLLRKAGIKYVGHSLSIGEGVSDGDFDEDAGAEAEEAGDAEPAEGEA